MVSRPYTILNRVGELISFSYPVFKFEESATAVFYKYKK